MVADNITNVEPTQTIAIVEDDPTIALGLRDSLEFEGFRVIHAETGTAGIRMIERDNPDCIILDLMLPDLNGYQVCTEIRKTNSATPIIMLTARSQEADKIRGLDAGADDYVTKPFSVGELVARIRAILRRANRASVEAGTGPFQIGETLVDPVAQTLTGPRGVESVSFFEVELLRLLFEHQGQPVSRDEILGKVWGLGGNPNNRTVDNFVVKLRRKLEPVPEQPTHIRTVYGIGYKLVV